MTPFHDQDLNDGEFAVAIIERLLTLGGAVAEFFFWVMLPSNCLSSIFQREDKILQKN